MIKKQLIVGLLLVIAAGWSWADVPTFINVQGIVSPTITGNTTGYFRIYDANSAGKLILEVPAVFVKQYPGMMIVGTDYVLVGQNGFFNTQINVGNVTFNKPYWMEITIGSDILPRQQLLSAPYALTAQNLGGVAFAYNGGIGIGTTQPAAPLEIIASQTNVNLVSSNGSSVIQLINNGTASNYLGAINFDSGNTLLGQISYQNDNAFHFRTDFINDQLVIDKNGNVGIGTSTPASKLVVNGDMKLIASSAPPAQAGKIYFDSTSNRLNYNDGTKWIEMDPAYTTQSIKIAMVASDSNTYTGSHTYTISVPELATKGIIITGIGGHPFPNQTDSYFTITVSNPGQTNSPTASCYTYTHFEGGQGFFNYTLPIPIKFVGGTTISYQVQSNYYYSLYQGYIQYIPLPL